MSSWGACLFLEVDANAILKPGSLVKDLGGYQFVDQIYLALDKIRDDPRPSLRGAIVKAEPLIDLACYESLSRLSSSKNHIGYRQLYLYCAIHKGWPFDITLNNKTRQATLLNWISTERNSETLWLRTCSPDYAFHRGISNRELQKFCSTSCAVTWLVLWQIIADQQPRNENESVPATVNGDHGSREVCDEESSGGSPSDNQECVKD